MKPPKKKKTLFDEFAGDSYETEETREARKKPKDPDFRSSGPAKPTKIPKAVQAVDKLMGDDKEKKKKFKDKTKDMMEQEPITSADPWAPLEGCKPEDKEVTLNFPYGYGKDFFVGPTHSDTGSGNLHSALDFYYGRPRPCTWGPDCTGQVHASHPGVMHVISNCNVVVNHECSKTTTTYYHMEKMLVEKEVSMLYLNIPGVMVTILVILK